jgi:hypothetical protein
LLDAVDAFAPSLLLQKHPERSVNRVLERNSVQPAGGSFFVFEGLSVIPCFNLGFDGGDIGPSEECLVTVCANDLAGWVNAVNAIKERMKNLPAALTRRSIP